MLINCLTAMDIHHNYIVETNHRTLYWFITDSLYLNIRWARLSDQCRTFFNNYYNYNNYSFHPTIYIRTIYWTKRAFSNIQYMVNLINLFFFPFYEIFDETYSRGENTSLPSKITALVCAYLPTFLPIYLPTIRAIDIHT